MLGRKTSVKPSYISNSEDVRKVSCRELFMAFFSVGIIGFGGVLPWTRRMIVEQRQWLTDEEFVHMLSLCQILPGANVGNLAVCLGARFAGLRGAFSALTGLFLAPFFIVIALAAFYSHFVHVPIVENIFRGVSAAAAGLILSMGIKIMRPICRTIHAVTVALLAMMGILLFKIPLLWVVFTLAPLSIAALWLKGKTDGRS